MKVPQSPGSEEKSCLWLANIRLRATAEDELIGSREFHPPTIP